jgi:hypothetical protein
MRWNVAESGVPRPKTKGLREAGLSVFQVQLLLSVLRDDRAAPAVVDADQTHIDVLADAIGVREQTCRRRKAGIVMPAEDVIVLSGDRPVLGEAEFQADAQRAAPTGFRDAVESDSRLFAV